MNEIRRLPAVEDRVEDGPVQFGDDWPGTFIRGDSSFAYAGYLRRILTNEGGIVDPISMAGLCGLLDLLQAGNLALRSEPPARGGAQP